MMMQSNSDGGGIEPRRKGYGGMTFALGVALLLVHAIPAIDLLLVFRSFEPTVRTITGSVIVGYVAMGLMIYGLIEGLVKRTTPHAMTIALAVIFLLSIPVALSQRVPGYVSHTYVCTSNGHITFLSTNVSPPKSCRPYRSGEGVPVP